MEHVKAYLRDGRIQHRAPTDMPARKGSKRILTERRRVSRARGEERFTSIRVPSLSSSSVLQPPRDAGLTEILRGSYDPRKERKTRSERGDLRRREGSRKQDGKVFSLAVIWIIVVWPLSASRISSRCVDRFIRFAFISVRFILEIRHRRAAPVLGDSRCDSGISVAINRRVSRISYKDVKK